LSTAPARRHGFLFADDATGPDTIRSETGPQPIDFGLPGLPLLRSSGKKDFPAAWLEALRYRPECNQTVAGCLNAAKPESRTVNAT
jgi:hypothetical protein